ncbi:MAG: hypothetical protein M3136_04565 [Thermoproteota archaeon]|nr:hypothetical protein [Thermoproteota archaeon]
MSKSSIALILSAILIMSIATFTTTASAQQGEIQEESDGGLTATINGDSFTTGDTITVTGTVEERDINSSVCIEVIDPNSESVNSSCPDVTVDNTFTFSFEAGINSEFYTRPMEASGNYRMILTYLVPDEPTSGEDFSEEVEFVFAYRHVEGQQQQQQQQQTTDDNDTATTNPIRRTINVTAINNMVTQGLDYVEKLNATIQTNATDTGKILRDVKATQRVLQNIQGNLTGVTPLAQGEVFLPTNTTRSTTT